MPKDVQRAAEHYRVAAEAGHVAAQYALGYCCAMGNGGQVRPARGLGRADLHDFHPSGDNTPK